MTRAEAILLAAGASRRAGGINKLLAQIDGVPMVRRSTVTAAEALGNPVIVVTGHDAAAVGDALDDLPVRMVHCAQSDLGMAESLKTGLAALSPETDLVFVCLADMPFVAAETFAALLQAATENPQAQIFVPTHDGRRGNPVLWRRAFLPALTGVSGDMGGRGIIRDNESLVCEVPVQDMGVTTDLDTAEDIRAKA